MTLALFAIDPSTRAARLNPIAKITALIVVSVPLLVSRDLVTSTILAVVEVLTIIALGLGRQLLTRGWPIALGVSTLWLANFLASGSVTGLLPVSVRLLALGLPGLVLVLSTEPVDLADALVQKWHAPPRWAYGALAAFRLMPLLAQELATMRRARRARGLSAGWTPWGWVRTAVALLFGLLVQAIRRAVRLAAAMDSRGFDVQGPRTFARQSVLRRRDWAFMAGACAVVVLAMSVSVASGQWRFLLS